MKATLVFTGNNGPKNAVSNNTAFMTRELISLGFSVEINQPDLSNPSRFSSQINDYLSNYPLIILIGGLGTNFNPNAKEILASNLSLSLTPHQESVNKLRQIYSRRNMQPTNEDLRYVTVPAAAHVISDDNYAIPGFALNSSGRVIVALPDNDDVYVDMYVKNVFPYLAGLKNLQVSKEIINIFGLSSTQAENILRTEVMANEALLSIFSKATGAKYVHITAINDGRYPAAAGVAELSYRIKNKLGSLVSNENIELLPANIIRLLTQYELTISIAEGITDGNLAKNLLAINGGSQVIKTQVNSLINEIKHKEMNVPKDILKDFPDASEHMAMAMSAGVLENGIGDIAVSISGGMISDSRGGLNSTGFVSLATEQGVLVKKVDLIGLAMAESQIRSVFTIAAMEMLYVFLKDLPNSVHNLFELKTLRIKDLDKTLENIRKKEEILKQREMEEVTWANKSLLPFRATLPKRFPPFLPKPPLPKQNLKKPKQTQQNQGQEDINRQQTPQYNQPSTLDGAVPMNPPSTDKNINTKDGAIPMDENNYNNSFNPNQNHPPWEEESNKQRQAPQNPNLQNQWSPPQGGYTNPQQEQFGAQQQNQWGQQQPQEQFGAQQQNQWGQQPPQEQFGAQQQNQWGQQPPQEQFGTQQQNQWGQQPPEQFGTQQQNQWGQQPPQEQFGAQQQNQWGQQPPQEQFGAQQQNQWGQQPPQEQFGAQQQNPNYQNQWRQPPQGQGGYVQPQGQYGDQQYKDSKNIKKKYKPNDNTAREELSFLQEARMILLPHKGNSVGKNILKIVLLLAILAFAIFAGYFVNLITGDSYQDGTIINPLSLYSQNLEQKDIPDTYPENFSKDFAMLFAQNPDIKGIVELEGGKKQYPVVQSDSNVQYKSKDFYQNEGSVSFLDSRSDMFNKTTNTLVYGYSTKQESLLKEVAQYSLLEYYKENPTIKFNSVYENSDYAVFASFVVSENKDHNDTYSYANYVNAISEEEFLDIIYDAKARSTIVTDVDVEYGDEIIFLSTDITDFDGARAVVVARKMTAGEDINAEVATLNQTPLYPEAWYEVHGGTPPNIEPRPSELLPIDLSLENPFWEVTELESSQPEKTSSSKPESSLPPSSKVESSKASSSSSESSKEESKEESSKTEETSKEQSMESSESSKIPLESVSSSESESESENESPPPVTGGSTVSVTYNGSQMTGDSIDIVSRVVAAEMSGFYPTEALKAQAVATYTFIIYNNNKGVSPEVPMREPSNNIINAVSAVNGQLITYGGSVAFTPYFAISAGRTNASQEVWTESRPYLISVDSSACTASPHYQQTRTLSLEDVRSRIESKLGLYPTSDPSTWFAVTSKTQGGYNANMTIDGSSTTDTGRNINGFFLRTVFGLRSAAFDVSYSGDSFTFTTYGYGHGVGMSQVGTYHLVNTSGYDYRQVLSHYYPGTNVG